MHIFDRCIFQHLLMTSEKNDDTFVMRFDPFKTMGWTRSTKHYKLLQKDLGPLHLRQPKKKICNPLVDQMGVDPVSDHKVQAHCARWCGFATILHDGVAASEIIKTTKPFDVDNSFSNKIRFWKPRNDSSLLCLCVCVYMMLFFLMWLIFAIGFLCSYAA